MIFRHVAQGVSRAAVLPEKFHSDTTNSRSDPESDELNG
jgi:hypothetical protein